MPDTITVPVHALRGLAVLLEPPGPEHERLATALGLPESPGRTDWSDVFLFQLYPYASVHLGPEGMLGGIARDRVAGFWRAVGLTPPKEPDHLSALIGLYASLAEREAGAGDAERGLVEQARRTLLDEHLSPWVFAWLVRVGELAGPAYAAWAGLLTDVLRSEVAQLEERRPSDEDPAAGRPGTIRLQHLAGVEPIADPRDDESVDLLSEILAPVRSGFIVTRADLAGIARALDVGLRAGERRYALTHLLAQDARGTLSALAHEARRQGAGHAARPWVGPSAAWFAHRCEATAALLERLSEEASE